MTHRCACQGAIAITTFEDRDDLAASMAVGEGDNVTSISRVEGCLNHQFPLIPLGGVNIPALGDHGVA